MPELPDVEVYCESLCRFYAGATIERIDVRSPFLVRSVEPDLLDAEGSVVENFFRLGKRIVWRLDGELHPVMHLMIAGRLHRKPAGARPEAKTDLAAFHFTGANGAKGTLMLTEASPRKRASLNVLQGGAGLAEHDRGGLEPLDCSIEQFAERLRSENHTLKRSLTDQRLFSGIGTHTAMKFSTPPNYRQCSGPAGSRTPTSGGCSRRRCVRSASGSTDCVTKSATAFPKR